MERKTFVFYPIDLVYIILNFLFAIFSFLNAGKLYIKSGNLVFDREILMGFFFLIANFLILLWIKISNPSKNKLVQFFRLFYGQVFYAIYFPECITLSQLFYNNNSFDSIFAYLDFLIFHYQPAVEFSKPFINNRYINELFFFSYFFYYLLMTAGWWILFARKKHKLAHYCYFVLTLSFGFLYIWYTFFPVKGPKFFIESLYNVWYSNFQGFYFTELMKRIFNSTNLGGAAFPSSHVAISLIALFLNRNYNRNLMPVILPLTFTLMLSTVYLYAHYFVDVVGGIFAAVILYTYVPLLHNFFINAARKLSQIFKIKYNFKEISSLDEDLIVL
ncbi:MAG: phosphatase PAP2 family protein [Exilispira sp.]